MADADRDEVGAVSDAAVDADADFLAEIEAACDAAESDPSLLARPLRVVVASNALREHLAATLVARAGRARLGVQVQTLDLLAREIVSRAGHALAPDTLTPIAVRAFAQGEDALRADLDLLDDGYASVVASVDDLLDAGFTADLADVLAEALAENFGGRLRARVAALLRVAAETHDALTDHRIGHRSALLTAASARVRAAGLLPDEILPARGLLLVGIHDATGVQLDLLESLAAVLGADVWLEDAAADAAFGERLRERMTATGRARRIATARAPEIVATRHVDPEDEARAAAAWARARLDEDGARPERIAIVARDLTRFRLALRRQLRRHGVPYSGVGERGAAGPAARRLAALLDLLERGRALPAERWLDALASGIATPDLRDALHVHGIATLEDLADFAPASDGGEGEAAAKDTRLPARLGLHLGKDGVPRAIRRKVTPAQLAALAARARRTCQRLANPPPALPAFFERLQDLVRALGWRRDTPGYRDLFELFPDPERLAWPPVPEHDWPRLLRRALVGAGYGEIGGSGGGVQVLSVMEARGCRFDALRVIGLNRGVFPRRLGEDPLLPDAVRRVLRDVLPDLPIKLEAHEEERFLFAQLLRAAPRVWLSCARTDNDGRATPVSPLLERADVELREAPVVATSPRDAWLEAALHGGRAAFAQALPKAIAAGRRAAGLPEVEPGDLARTRLALLDELDGRGARRASLGPYLGVVGGMRGPADLRRAAPSVSHLENEARCPWKYFLERLLGLEPQPDVWRALPGGKDRRLVGNAVHGALQILCDPRRDDFGWPGSAPQSLLVEAAREEVRKSGVALPGYASALAAIARPYVEVAQQLDRDAQPTLIEVEKDVTVSLATPGGPRELRFRVDRTEEIGGDVFYTDWKTGNLEVDAKKEDSRDRQYVKQVAAGKLLQGHTYALDGVRARYVYLAPKHDEALRVLEADAGGAQQAAFEASVATLLAARDAGAFPPRLRKRDEDQEPGTCSRYCDIRQACLRGDSGVRRRLGAWLDATSDVDDASSVEKAARAVWQVSE